MFYYELILNDLRRGVLHYEMLNCAEDACEIFEQNVSEYQGKGCVLSYDGINSDVLDKEDSYINEMVVGEAIVVEKPQGFVDAFLSYRVVKRYVELAVA